MDDDEVEFIADAVEFVAEHGHPFLRLYDFDLATGAWTHKEHEIVLEPFSRDAALECCGPAPTVTLSVAEHKLRYADYLFEAQRLAARLASGVEGPELILSF